VAPESYRRSRSGEDGFTLLEVLISLAILSGVIVTIITVMNSHIAASMRLSESSQAMVIAREKIEQIHLYGVSWGKDEHIDICTYVPEKG